MAYKRVVVTGMGLVTPVGIGKEEFWGNLVAGKSGISDVSNFYSARYSTYKGGSVRDFDKKRKAPAEMGRAAQFAIEAASEALTDAMVGEADIDQKRIGVIFGTTNGESHVLEKINRIWVEKGEEEVWAETILKYPLDSISRNVASFFGIKGFTQMIPTACAAGNYSIGYSYDLIRRGMADMMIAGGADPLTRYAFAGFGRLFAMAPEKVQPFDRNRKGMMIGEGSAALVLETEESAIKRGAAIYGEIAGYGLSCDAHHMTAPRVEGIVKVVEKAIKNSGIKKDEVDYISAHGTGTPTNDKVESAAIKEVFGDLTKGISVSSIKSMLGHTMGAASAIEACACLLAIKTGIVPPTINHETPDIDCDIDCVPNTSKARKVDTVLNNSFAFGGNNACLAMKRYR
jgi:3-oxoacyl-[acyl-carrier-protein] synthase II